MLVRFNVKNFLSFDERKDGRAQEFAMIAGAGRSKLGHLYDDGQMKVLKLAAIYGANASGKSNLVKAMSFMRQTIIENLPYGYSQMYCRTKEGNKGKDSYFETEISMDGKYYSYGFEIRLNEGRFTSEWLYELKKTNNALIFERDIVNKRTSIGKIFSKEEKLFRKLESYLEDIDETKLFLSVMNEGKDNLYSEFFSAAILKRVYGWFERDFDINMPERPISSYSYFADEKQVEEAKALLSSFGTGISDFKLVEIPLEKAFSSLSKELREKIEKDIEQAKVMTSKDPERKMALTLRRGDNHFYLIEVSDGREKCETISLYHGNAMFGIDEESDGTARLLDLIEVFFAPESKTFVIDELDRCLHPALSYHFIKLFLQKAADKNMQLIVTTHESRLLDFDLLRKDEIWFTSKNGEGATDIYSLEQFEVRFDRKIDKAYLEGRYGAVPVFTDPTMPASKEQRYEGRQDIRAA